MIRPGESAKANQTKSNQIKVKISWRTSSPVLAPSSGPQIAAWKAATFR
jgi:hypothetical protein